MVNKVYKEEEALDRKFWVCCSAALCPENDLERLLICLLLRFLGFPSSFQGKQAMVAESVERVSCSVPTDSLRLPGL